MDMKKTLTEHLHDLRLAYEREKTTKQNEYARRLKEIDDKINEIKNHDYSAPYKAKYAQFLSAVESVLPKIEEIERKTHGLQSALQDYIRRSYVWDDDKLRRRDGVEEVFQMLLRQMNDFVDHMAAVKDMAEIESVLRQYAGILVTLRYIHKNDAKILQDSGIPEGERQKDLQVWTEKWQSTEQERTEALKLENLDCYPFYQEVQSGYKRNYERVSRDILGSENEQMYFDTEYRYLIGFYKEKISDEDRKFAKEILRLTDMEISCMPVYFEPEKGYHNIIINGKAADFEKPLYKKFVNQFYFSMARRLPANGLKYTAIACNQRTNAVFISAMENFIAKLSDSKLYIEKGVVNTGNNFASAINHLREKSLHFMTSDNSDIYEFNRKSSIDRKPFYLTYVDCYPLGLETYRDGASTLQQLLTEGKRGGFITVLSQATDGFQLPESSHGEPPPKFENVQKQYDAMEIVFSGDEVTVNGKPVILDIADASFGDNDYVAYWTKLKAYYEKKEIFYLEKLFNDLDDRARKSGERKSILETGKMSVPLGYVGTELYEAEYDLNKACHAFILGSTGSGKSSFLHTFILGTAYKYSPQEIQFYLADWKQTEFSGYKINDFPHVRYIQDNSTLPEYVSLLHMMLRICSQRNALIQSKGQSSFLGYNAVVPEKDRLPFIFFIIDEYQVMIQQSGSGNKRQADTWQSLMSSILGIVRSAGIGVVLSSQTLDDITISVENVEKRLLLGSNKELLKKLCYNNESKEKYGDALEQDEQYLSVAQSGHVVLGFRGKSVTQRFRAAYTGEGEVRVKCVNRIKERFPDRTEKLILGGSKEGFSVSELTEPAYETILEAVRKDAAESDDDFDFTPYDDTAYPVYVGVTSNDTSPVSLQFNTKGHGYAVYTQSSKRLCLLMRTTMLSFLYKTTAHKGAYECQRVHYFGSEDDYEHDIGIVCRQEEFLEKHIAHCDVEFDAYASVCALMKLYGVYTARKEKRRAREGFAPVLAVFHGVEWLTEKLDDTFEEYEREAENRRRQPRATTQSSVSEDAALQEMIARVRAMNPDAPEEYIISRAKMRLAKSSAPKQEEEKPAPAVEEVYSKEQVKEAFKILYREGCRYRIFVFAGSSVMSDLKKLRERALGSMDEDAFSKYAVFGSQQENEEKFSGSSNGEGDVNTCFVYPVPEPNIRGMAIDPASLQVGVLTRLYKFGKADYDWWETLENRLEEF